MMSYSTGRRMRLLAAMFMLLAMCSVRVYAASGTNAQVSSPVVTGVTGYSGKITVKWQSVTDAKSYKIYRKDVQVPASKQKYVLIGETAASVLSYEDTKMKVGYTYYYAVQTVSAAGESPLSAEVTPEAAKADSKKIATCSAALLPTTKVTGATAKSGAIEVTWDGVTYSDMITGYRILRKRDDETAFTEDVKDAEHCIVITDPTSVSYTDKNVEVGHSYTYTIRTYLLYPTYSGETLINKLRKSSYDTTGVTSNVVTAFTRITGSKTADGKIALTWKETDTDGYILYRKVGENGAWKTLAAITAPKRTFYWDTKAVPGKSYTYGIAAYTEKNGKQTVYDRTDMTSAITCAPASAVPTKLAVKKKKDTLVWKKVAKCAGYIVYYKNASTKNKWKVVQEVDPSVTKLAIPKSGTDETLYTVRAFVNVGSKQLQSPEYYTMSNAEKTLKGKSGLFIGDSLTSGKSWGGNKVTVPYPERVALLTGLKVKNAGVNGSPIARSSASDTSSMSVRIKKLKVKKYSLIVLAGGTNDYAKNIKLGKITDKSDRTFYGALNSIFALIKKQNPKAKVVVMLPVYRMRVNGYDGKAGFKVKNKAGFTLADYRKALKTVAKNNNAKVWDIGKKIKLTESSAYYMLGDGLHMTQDGYLAMGDSAAAVIKKVMK